MARKPRKTEAKTTQEPHPPGEALDDRIRRRAYQIWEEEGWPHGQDAEHWRRAEHEVAQGAGPGPEPAAKEDRSRAVAPPKSRKRPGASAKLGGTPSAPAAGKGRGERG